MASLVEAKERALKREKWQTNALWIFLVLLSTVFLYIGSQRINTPGGTWFGIQACFWFMAGTVYLMKHFINQLTVQVLKETKQLQVQVLELRAMLGDGGKRN